MYFELLDSKLTRLRLSPDNIDQVDICVGSHSIKQEILNYLNSAEITVVDSLADALNMHKTNLRKHLVVHHTLLKGKYKRHMLKYLLKLCINQLEEYSDNELVSDGEGFISIQTIKDIIK